MNPIEAFAAIPAITVLCLLAAQVCKVFLPASSRHIPLLCGVLGLCLGVACHYTVPGLLPADNVFAAAATGAVSGWAATGLNQTWKRETHAGD